jgi:hypothetical protein
MRRLPGDRKTRNLREIIRRSDPKDRNSKNIREDSVSGTIAIAITDVTRIVVFLPPAACRCRYDTLPSHRP